MGKVRVSSIAKEFQVNWKDVVAVCQQLGYTTLIHHANVAEEEQAERIRETLSKRQPGGETAEEREAAPKTPGPAPTPQAARKRPPRSPQVSAEIMASLGAASPSFRLGSAVVPIPVPKVAPKPKRPPKRKEKAPAEPAEAAEAPKATAVESVEAPPAEEAKTTEAAPVPIAEEAKPKAEDTEATKQAPAKPRRPSQKKIPGSAGVVITAPAKPKIVGPRVVKKADRAAKEREGRARSERARVAAGAGDGSFASTGASEEAKRAGGRSRHWKEGSGDDVEEVVVVDKPGAKRKRPKPFEQEERITHVAGHTVTISDTRKEKFSSGVAKGKKPARRTIIIRRPDRPHVRKVRETKIEITPPITVKSFSERTGLKVADIIKDLLLKHSIRGTVNEVLDEEVAVLLGMDHGLEITVKHQRSVEDKLKAVTQIEDSPEDMKPRPPVVTMLGHVDHGKTSLLDRIRSTNLVEEEAGGITQHVGAYQVATKHGTITFLDTPGHEAFTAMRARGANVTDIAVLVVAADDGVMPQTEEAISHARAAQVPIVVALNKMDKPQANPQMVLQKLAGSGVLTEEWGGEVGVCKVSAVTGEGIDGLLERVALEAEVLELKANPDRRGIGSVIEARMIPAQGVVATVLVRHGTLSGGDIVVCGAAFGRVRALFDSSGKSVETAGPSMPVRVLGLNEMPESGDEMTVVDSIDTARQVAQDRLAKRIQAARTPRKHITLETFFSDAAKGKAQVLNVILKVDAFGSVEPIMGVFERLNTREVSVQVLHSGVGGITEGDVLLADASDAVIIGFNVVPDDRARQLAEESGVEVRLYEIIYRLTEDMTAALEGMLEPEVREDITGRAEVRQVFRISKVGSIAGCYVTEGTVIRSGSARLIRDNQVIYQGDIASLRRVKEDVREVPAGTECGLKVEGFDDVKVGDRIECLQVQEVQRSLESVRDAERGGESQ